MLHFPSFGWTNDDKGFATQRGKVSILKECNFLAVVLFVQWFIGQVFIINIQRIRKVKTESKRLFYLMYFGIGPFKAI